MNVSGIKYEPSDVYRIFIVLFLQIFFFFFFQNKKFEETIRFMFFKSYSRYCLGKKLGGVSGNIKQQSGVYQSGPGSLQWALKVKLKVEKMDSNIFWK